MLELARLILAHRPRIALVDWAPGTSVEAGLSHVATAYAVHHFHVLTSWYGDRVAKGRQVAMIGKEAEETQTFLEALSRHEVATPEGLDAILLPLDAVPPDQWARLPGVVWDSRLRRCDDRFLPVADGTWQPGGGRGKQLVYSCKGPMLTPTLHHAPGQGHGVGVYHDPRNKSQAADCRPLQDVEVWMACGYTSEEWRARLEGGGRPQHS